MKMNFGNVRTTKNIKEANCITHSGTFHADEVFATAFLSLLKENITVLRVNEVTEENNKALIYDVGLGKFDHHQVGGNGKRENGVMYAACGLIWREYGKEILEKIAIEDKYIDSLLNQIDKNLIQFIDANDNGITPNIDTPYKYVTVSSLIADFNPRWDEVVDADDKFIQAVEFAKKVVENVILSEISKLKAKDEVQKAIETATNGIMILDRFMPWKEFVLEADTPKAKDILFVVFPSNRGGYNVYTVPKEIGSFENRKRLPKVWSGLRDEQLQEITGVKTASFCHIACFICTAKTKEDAIKLATLAVENKEE